MSRQITVLGFVNRTALPTPRCSGENCSEYPPVPWVALLGRHIIHVETSPPIPPKYY